MSGSFDTFSYMSPNDFSGRYVQLHEFLTARQRALLDKSDARRNQLDSVEAVQAYAAYMKDTFIQKMGGIPERTCPLNAQVISRIDRGSYIIENLHYTARDGVYVPSSLYIPKGLSEPAPAVLFLSGHEPAARLAEAYQKVCQILVSAGLIVFAIDTVGQGERRNFYDPATGEYVCNGCNPDHDACGVPSLCTGRFIESYFMNDQMSAVDYMLTRPEIDPNRIGVTGCSGGGLQSLCVMTCDDRVAAAAPATFTTTRREIMDTCQSQDAEQIWPGCAAYGFDHFEPYVIFAPKPALILTVSSDFFPIEGAYEVYDTLKKIYGLYGKADQIEIFEDHACHAYTLNLANQAAEFFCRVFGVEQRKELCLEALPEEAMRVTVSGNVKGDFPDAQTIPEETHILAAECRKNRVGISPKEWLVERVMYERISQPARPRISDDMHCRRTEGYVGRSVMWWVQRRLMAYGVLISAEETDASAESCPVVIALWDHGTRAIAEHEDWIRSTCDGGKQVLVVDLPGVGNIEQANLWYDWLTYRGRGGTLNKLCCDLMYMDDSMAAMQTYHVLRTVDMLKEYLHKGEVSLYCDGQEGVYGIMAGYLAEINREYGDHLLCNVEKQILSQNPLVYDNTLCYVIPGMLQHFDYDELM